MASSVGQTNASFTDQSGVVGLAHVPSGRWIVDPHRSRVGFTARHLLVSKINGQFHGVEGIIDVTEDSQQSSVTASADAASIETGDAARDEHLRSPDFLDSDRWPKLTLTGSGLRPLDHKFLLTAQLTIRAITRKVLIVVAARELDRDAPQSTGHTEIPHQAMRFTGEARINRKDFGLKWNPAIETGGVVVGDMVELRLDVVAVRIRDLNTGPDPIEPIAT